MTFFKKLAVFLALTAAVLSLGACGTSNVKSDSPAEAQSSSAAGETPGTAGNTLSDGEKEASDNEGISASEKEGSAAVSGEKPSGEEGVSAEGEKISEDWKTPAEGGPAYQSLYPDFYAPRPFAANLSAQDTIYLTFDDGPSERTDEVLATLSEKNVKATFFVIGQSSEENLERMRKAAKAGHTIGMHSYSHDYEKLYTSVEAFLEDFYLNFSQIRDTTGVTPTVFRFPGGSTNSRGLRQELIAEMERRGFVPFDWNITSGDAAPGGARADEVLGNITNQSAGKTRGVVLCHDSSAKVTTAQALPDVIDMLRGKGFTLAPLTPDVEPVLF